MEPQVLEAFCLMTRGRLLRDSNEAEALVILKALRIFSFVSGRLIVERDSFNAISWVSLDVRKLWKLQFALNEIKFLASNLCHFS